MVESPAQRVGGVRIIGKLTAGGLRHRESNVHIAALLQHHIGQIVGGQRIVGLNLQHLLVLLLGVVPILLALVDAASQQVESGCPGIGFGSVEISLQRLIGVAARALHHAEPDQRFAVLLIQVGGLFELLFRPR